MCHRKADQARALLAQSIRCAGSWTPTPTTIFTFTSLFLIVQSGVKLVRRRTPRLLSSRPSGIGVKTVYRNYLGKPAFTYWRTWGSRMLQSLGMVELEGVGGSWMLVSSFLSRRNGLVPPTLMSKGASLDKVNFGQFHCLPMHVLSNLHKPRIGKKKFYAF